VIDVPRPRPPYLHRETTRHGKTVWYVRVDKGPRIRLRAEYGTPGFWIEYQAAVSGSARPVRKGAPKAGSLAWLIEQYRKSTAWTKYSPATRRQRENIFKQVISTAGHQPLTQITRAVIVAGRDRRRHTPSQARHFLDTMRGLFGWAVDAQHCKTDPTFGVEGPVLPRGGGFRVWTEEDVAAYERRWPIGTRQRVWLDVLLYSGLRRGDAVRYGRQHVHNNVGTIKVQKSGYTVEVTLPILPALARTLAAGPCGDLTFIVGARGRPLTKESFGNEFRDACRDAGVPGSAHGLRKLGATRAADNGATESELEAIFGWTGGHMASLYTRAANRKKLATAAMHKLDGGPMSATGNDERTSIPAPIHEVRVTNEKA
jgi:integrase